MHKALRPSPSRGLSIGLSIGLTLALCLPSTAQTRREEFDLGWLFMEGDVPQGEQPGLKEEGWTRVDLPHDWDIAHVPSPSAASGNDGGYYPGGIGWYRKHFPSPKATEGARVVLHFEGVYQRCSVYVNGQLAGRHSYGYTPFRIDITDYLTGEPPVPHSKEMGNTPPSPRRGKECLVAVRVDNSAQPNCRWYSGSGIYRHVWLETYTPQAMDDPTLLHVSTEHVYGLSPDGLQADSATLCITYADSIVGRRTFHDVELWSPSHPRLYDIEVGSLRIKHGFRTVSYSAEEGFKLNGQPLLISGACVHHDDGILGAMAFDAAEVRKVRLMKEAGFNLVRTSHNPPSEAFLNACDSLGMMVVDEAFDGWRTQKTAHDYHEVFDSLATEDVEAMVRRDRNHPSIVAWSIGNEVIERKEISVIRTARMLKAAVLSIDKTRPVTEALCSWDEEWDIFDPHAEVLDIVGYNYMMHKHEGDHLRCPERVMWQTESYPRDAFLNWQRTSLYPYIIGDIVWTGLDYLGESGIGQTYHPGEPDGEHYNGLHFPFHGARCGDVDITGWRKPISHYRELLWKREAAPTLYMAVREPEGYKGGVSETLWSVWPTCESWNWPGWEGQPIDVEVYTKAPSVRLYLDGEAIGEQAVDSLTEYKALFTLPYRPGTLRAVALTEDGQEGESVTLSTTGKPTALRLTPEHESDTSPRADGEDVAFAVLEVIDSEGRTVPDAEVEVTVSVTGQGTLLCCGSADMSSTRAYTDPRVTTSQGRALIVLRTMRKAGLITVTASAKGLPPASLTLRSKR